MKNANATLIVVDSSVAVDMFVPLPLGARIADKVLGEECHVPHLIDIEFVSALRRLTRHGGLGENLAQNALDDFLSWPVIRHSHEALLPVVWRLRDSVSAYDASYVALAELLDAPLLTCDAKLARSHGHQAEIVLLA